jgi:pimeloyl-ACP methyl ester carboxylesterase
MQGSDDDAFFTAWDAAARRHVDAADAALSAGHSATARGRLLRAAACLSVAYRPLYGTPVDPRLHDAFERQMAAFDRAMTLAEPPIEPLGLTFEGHPMPAYLAPARGATAGERRPLVVLTNGYDATVVDLYLAMGRAITERGYHCLFFDGPGQGSLLVRDAVPMVADWERVVGIVVDAAVARADVDPHRIALQGWSLGGFLSLRAASGEPRLAACIADPPGWSALAYMTSLAKQVGMSPAAVAALPDVSDADQARMTALIEASPELRWQVIRRGFWVNGAADLRHYLAAINPFRLDGRADDIRCPVLATAAEEDPLAAGAQRIVEALSAPATLLRFTTAEGAGAHCEMQNRWLANQRILDWLDETLERPGGS